MGTPSGSVVAHSWLVCALFACSEPPSENSEPRCPMGARPDEARATRLRARLEGTEAAGYLAAEHRICFTVHGPAVVTDEGDVMLPRDERDDALAARLGHLLEHIVRGTLRNDPAASCDVLVAEALRREASAYALEIRLRDGFGLPRAPFVELETAYRATGEPGILAWLEAHPEGGAGIDALARSYHQRCEANR